MGEDSITSALRGPQEDQGDDKVTGYLKGLSERMFDWKDADHKQAADYADQRAQELRNTQNGPRMAKGDLSGHIAELERTAKYHRSQIKQPQKQSH